MLLNILALIGFILGIILAEPVVRAAKKKRATRFKVLAMLYLGSVATLMIGGILTLNLSAAMVGVGMFLASIIRFGTLAIRSAKEDVALAQKNVQDPAT